MTAILTSLDTLRSPIPAENHTGWVDILHAHSFSVAAIINQDGTIRYKSPSIKHLFGYDPSELEGKEGYINIHPDDRKRVEEVFEQALLNPASPITCEFRYRHKNRGYLIVEANVINLIDHPAIQGFVLHYRDNTKLVKTNKKLVESREHLSLALKGAEIGVWDWDIVSGNMFYDRTWGEMLGFKPYEMRYDEDFWESLIHPDDKAEAKEKLEAHLRGETNIYEHEYRICTKSGTYKWILDKGQVITWDEDGNPLRAAGIHQDIDSRKQAEEALIERTEALQKLNLQLEQFAYITSHDVRAPMSNLLGLIDLMDFDKNTVAENKNIWRMLKHSISDLHLSMENVEKMFSTTRMQVEKPVEVNLSSMIKEVLSTYNSSLQAANAQVIINTESAEIINYPPSHLQGFLHNLISNAIKFRHPDRPLKLEISSGREKNYLSLSIQDNGRGLDLEKYGQRLFNIHERFHSDVFGKGLGLFMLKKQVSMLGGDIRVNSEVDKGSCFTLLLMSQ